MVNILVEKDVIKELILDLCFSELIDIFDAVAEGRESLVHVIRIEHLVSLVSTLI